MFVGRKKDLKFLEDNISAEDNKLLVLYGHKGVGKSSLMLRFAADKQHYYYASRTCSENEQIMLWSREMNCKAESFENIFSAMKAPETGKLLIVIDEFQNILKYSDTFMNAVTGLVRSSKPVMVVLLSSSISFVETDFVPRIGSLALGISGFYKLSELNFMDCVNFFKDYSTRACMEVYSLLGGIPAYWNAFDTGLDLKENIIRNILSPSGFLYSEGERIVSAELRELNVYSTLLNSLAEGRIKLNELHVHSGFSRAKISVYLKNLMERELVEKVFSYDNASGINAKKGIYRIALRFLEFYYRFMFSERSALECMPAGSFYDRCIEPGIRSFHQGNFCKVCSEYLDILNQNNMLPIKASSCGEWVGKKGTIDIVMQDEEGENLLAFCDWEKDVIDMDMFNRCMETAKEARLSPDHLYVFAAGSFTEELKAFAGDNSFVKLVDIDTL